MSIRSLSTILAQTPDTGLPVGKAVAMILFFGLVGIVSVFGLFASKETLESMSGFIGTRNPLVARVVCGLGTVVGFLAVFVTVLSLLGKL